MIINVSIYGGLLLAYLVIEWRKRSLLKDMQIGISSNLPDSEAILTKAIRYNVMMLLLLLGTVLFTIYLVESIKP